MFERFYWIKDTNFASQCLDKGLEKTAKANMAYSDEMESLIEKDWQNIKKNFLTDGQYLLTGWVMFLINTSVYLLPNF